MMTATIARMRIEHFDGFWYCLDMVARERKYLAFLEAPPIEQSRAFVMNGNRRQSAFRGAGRQ